MREKHAGAIDDRDLDRDAAAQCRQRNLAPPPGHRLGEGRAERAGKSQDFCGAVAMRCGGNRLRRASGIGQPTMPMYGAPVHPHMQSPLQPSWSTMPQPQQQG